TFQKELKDFSPDIILADYTLPVFDGCSALKIVKERCPDVPFIFVSGTIGEDCAIESLKGGATDYVIKDRISRLAPAVRRALNEVEERIEYRKAERALRESEIRFRSLVESASDAIILTDGEGFIISWNKSAQRIFGYTKEEILGRPTTHVMPDRFRSDHLKRIGYINSNGNPYINGKTFESYGLRKDGSEFPLEISIATWNIEGEAFYSAIVRDITERKRSEETLHRNHTLLNAISDAQSHFIADSNPKVLFDNLLANLISLTRSEYGFIGEVLYNAKGEPYLKTYSLTNIAWDEKTREFYEKNAPSGMEFYNLKTLFGTVMATGRHVISNNPAGDSRRGGLPADHPPLNSFLGIPFYQGEKLVGMAGIANRPGGYEEELFGYLQPLLNTCANIIEAYRNSQQRKRAEEELKIKAQLLDDSTDSVFVHDLDGNFIYLNEMAYKSRGLGKEEMMSMNLHQIVIPEYEKLLKPRFRLLIEKGDGTFESAHFHKDGSVIPVEAHARIIESGGRKLVLSIIRDITERKRAEQALQYRLNFEKLITSISTNFINIASDRIDEEINRALEIIGEFTDVDRSYVFLVSGDGARTGITHEWNSSTIGSRLQEFNEVSFESSPWFAEKMKNLETIYIPSFTALPPGADIELSKYRNTRTKSIIVAPMVYGGVLFGYLGLTSVRKEITLAEDLIALLKIVGEIFMSALVRKMAEEAVWESETRFRAIFENAAIGMALMNVEGRPIVSNPALQEMLGYSGEELRDMVLTGLTHPDDMPVETGMFKDLMAGKRDNYQIEKRYIRKDRSQFWGRLTVSPVQGEGGRPQFGIGMVEDITERKQAEELLKEKARAELYGFIVSALPVFASGAPSQVRNNLVRNFAERFEKNIMPRFEEEMKRYDHDRSIRGEAVDIKQDELDFFISWLIGMFSNLGIRTRTAPQNSGRVFELLNCPWKGEASGNPIFCFICRTIMRRSLTWMPFKGSTDQKSSIANGSQVCRFEIHVK
ncbi:MAG: PAS domain S-box protein, partial [Candidatus Methanoperedens sp.]|nr:PAS domain S-box protein [Candidatus Methanoperedens sp.]